MSGTRSSAGLRLLTAAWIGLSLAGLGCGGSPRASGTDPGLAEPETTADEEVPGDGEDASGRDDGAAPPEDAPQESDAPDTIEPACPAGTPCDDGDPCTGDDRCQPDGTCRGQPGCDDGEPCTRDRCDPAAGCLHDAADTENPACRPDLVIETPARGATLQGAAQVEVRGRVSYASARWPVADVRINGQAVPVDPADLSFQAQVTAVQGLNPLVAEVADAQGMTDRVVQSFLYSTTWYATDPAQPSKSRVADGLVARLGPDAWDSDGAHADVAGLIETYVALLDVEALLANPVTTGKEGWCEYAVNVSNVWYGWPSVDLVPVAGGLKLDAFLPDFHADLDIPIEGFGCPDFTGTADATGIALSTTLKVSLDAAGKPQAKLSGTRVEIVGLDIRLDGVWGFLLNWIVNFFEQDLADRIEQEFEAQVAGQVEQAIEAALAGLTLAPSFDVPALFPGSKTVHLSTDTRFSRLDFTGTGTVVGMAAAVVAKGTPPHATLGAPGRAKCLGADTGSLALPQADPLQVAIHDDLVNEVAQGMFRGGALRFPVDASSLGADLSSYGITDLKLQVDFLLPPIVTSCPAGGAWWVQAGDVQVDADLSLFGAPTQVRAWATATVQASIDAAAGPSSGVAIALGEPGFLDLEIGSISGDLAGAGEALASLIKTQLVPQVLAAFTGKVLATFPIPEIDLGAVNASFAGQVIALDLQAVKRSHGWTVLSGNVR